MLPTEFSWLYYLTGEVVTNSRATSTENQLLEYIDNPSEDNELEQSSHTLDISSIGGRGLPMVTTNLDADDGSMESAAFETQAAEVEIH